MRKDMAELAKDRLGKNSPHGGMVEVLIGFGKKPQGQDQGQESESTEGEEGASEEAVCCPHCGKELPPELLDGKEPDEDD